MVYTLCHSSNLLSDAPFDDIIVKLCGEIGPTCVDFPLSESDECKLGVACPVKSGSTNTYKFTVEVKSLYPPVSVNSPLLSSSTKTCLKLS